MPLETEKAKINVDGKLWHRMGDIGYFDHLGFLWFLGRKTHLVIVDENTVHYPIRVEAIFNQHASVKRSALVKLTHGERIFPGIVIERKDGGTDLSAHFLQELESLAQSSSHTAMIKHFFLYDHFPVDVRHNIKIDRVKLSQWAQTQLSN
jgi:acyl-CoA synthetase (AMP-forming)/AMP-acid ligase II